MKKKNEKEFIDLLSSNKEYQTLYKILVETSSSFGVVRLMYSTPEIRVLSNGTEKYNWNDPIERASKNGFIKGTKNYEFNESLRTVIGGSVVKQQQYNPFQAFTDFLDQSHHIFKSKNDFLDFIKGNFSNIKDAETLKKLGQVFYLYVSEHLDDLLSEKREFDHRERIVNENTPENRSQKLLDLYPSNAIWKQKDAAAFVGMSTRTLGKRMKTGKFKTYKSKVYIASFLEYLNKHEPNYFNNALERDF